MEERPERPAAREGKKWPLRQTFAFLLVLGGCFWMVVGIVLKILFY